MAPEGKDVINGMIRVPNTSNKKIIWNGLVLRSLSKKIIIDLADIECIVEQPAGKLVGLSIGVFAKNNHRKISITAWTHNYEELIDLVVKKYVEMKHDNIDNNIRLMYISFFYAIKRGTFLCRG